MKSGGVKLVLCVQTIPLVKRCGLRSVFHMSVKKPILTFHRVDILFVCFYNCPTWFWNCSDRRVFCWFKKKLLYAFILIINNACVWSLQDIADNMSNWNMFIINCVSRCKQYKCSLIIWFITVLFEPHQFQSIKIDMHLLFVHMDFLVNKIFFNICFFMMHV
jgi:hypothetical protein